MFESIESSLYCHCNDHSQPAGKLLSEKYGIVILLIVDKKLEERKKKERYNQLMTGGIRCCVGAVINTGTECTVRSDTEVRISLRQ